MHPAEFIDCWPGYVVPATRLHSHDTPLIELVPQPGRIPCCGRCGQPSPLIHERSLRQLRDRDILDPRVLLHVPACRVDQAKRLSEDKPARKVVKQSRWLLPRNKENLKAGQAVKLQELLDANQPLATAHVLKDELKAIRYAPSVQEGWRRWRAWQRHARESGLAPLQQLARNLRKYVRGILASARFPMHTSQLEGVNNRIKVIRRMAYGFRDSEYCFLKIKATFPKKV